MPPNSPRSGPPALIGAIGAQPALLLAGAVPLVIGAAALLLISAHAYLDSSSRPSPV